LKAHIFILFIQIVVMRERYEEFENADYYEFEGDRVTESLEGIIEDALKARNMLPESCYVTIHPAEYYYEAETDEEIAPWVVGGAFRIICKGDEFKGSFHGVGTYIEDEDKIVIDSGDLSINLSKKVIERLKRLF